MHAFCSQTETFFITDAHEAERGLEIGMVCICLYVYVHSSTR